MRFFVVFALVVHNILISPYIIKTIFNWYLNDLFGIEMTWRNAFGLELFASLLLFLFARRTHEDVGVDCAWKFQLAICLGLWTEFIFAWLMKGVNF